MALSQLPKGMKTLLQPDAHTTSIIKATAPDPTPAHPKAVLVRVHACSPCTSELYWAANFPDLLPKDKVPVPTQDMAGEVVSAPKASGFAPGDRVFCRIDAGRPGAARNYALASVSELAKMDAAQPRLGPSRCRPLIGTDRMAGIICTRHARSGGYRGRRRCQERNGKMRVLITAAAGGVGSWALQLAAPAGAYDIVALASPTKGDFVRERGATEVAHYSKTSLEDWVAADPASREVDLVVDGVGGKTLVGRPRIRWRRAN